MAQKRKNQRTQIDAHRRQKHRRAPLTIEEIDGETVTLDQASLILKCGRNQGYEAAQRGEIYTIKIGSRLIVPKDWLRKKLAGIA